MTGIDAVTQHRVDYWLWVEMHAVPAERDMLLRLRDHWIQVNDRWFGGALVPPYITLTEPSTPPTYGQYCYVSSWGSRAEIRIRPSLLRGTHPHLRGAMEDRRQFVLDVLTHETVHQYCAEIAAAHEDSYHGHGPVFTATANRIGADMGLPPVVVRNRGGSKLAKAAQWPHCVRPVDYYHGAYQPGGTSTRDTVRCPHCSGSGRIPNDSPDGAV